MAHRMHEWLMLLGCRKASRSSNWYILDGFDSEFYLIFDAGPGPETPTASGTVDVLAERVGFDGPFRLIADANEARIVRLLFALGSSRFSYQTTRMMYGPLHR